MSNWFWYVLVIVLAIAVFAILMYALHLSDKYKEKLLNTSLYEVNTRTSIDNAIPNTLSSFIEDCFTDYQIMVLFPRNELYITDEREQEIIMDLAAKVTERMSPNFKQKLYQYYNPETFDKVLADKIYISVLNYCLGVNSNIRGANTTVHEESEK